MDKYLKEILKYKPTGKHLDIGCAYGYMLELTSQAGYDAQGIDPSHYAINQAPEHLKNKVMQGTIFDMEFSDKTFDVITMLDVFEHLDNPLSELKEINRILKDDGILLLSTGDSGSIASKILKRKWTFYNPPQHLFFFNTQTIKLILKNSDFEITKWFRVGKWLNLQYIIHLAKTTAELPVLKPILSFINSSNLGTIPIYINLRDNMVIIAKKSN
ncbi:MAG: class I SAM-dependent methyltransferase [bacterium]|nr:class I SAM-dependent methyltransferase [bacterium]